MKISFLFCLKNTLMKTVSIMSHLSLSVISKADDGDIFRLIEKSFVLVHFLIFLTNQNVEIFFWVQRELTYYKIDESYPWQKSWPLAVDWSLQNTC